MAKSAARPPRVTDAPPHLPMRGHPLSDDEFLRMRNFGQKSLDELKERLALRGFISADATSMSTDESDLPASAELDEAAAAELDREA